MNGLLAVDTETCGVDFWCGARPFLVTTCRPGEHPVYWRWDVDPYTRKVLAPTEDVDEVLELIGRGAAGTPDGCGTRLVCQNAKFDVHALRMLFADHGRQLPWPWDRTWDTLLAGHLLASNHPHNLTDMVAFYLGADLKPYEDRLEKATKDARRMVQLAKQRWLKGKVIGDPTDVLAEWQIAEKDREDMPSAGEQTWRYDYWLPLAVLNELGPDLLSELQEEDCRWWGTVLQEYANADSSSTVHLWQVMEGLIRERGLWKIWEHRMSQERVFYDLERRGVTAVGGNLVELREEYRKDVANLGVECVRVAKDRYGYDLELPKGASPNGSLRTFMLDVMGLEPVSPGKKAKTNTPTLNKEAMAHYLETLPPGSTQLEFVETLLEKRGKDTAVGYMNAYERFWVPHPTAPGYFVLHPNLMLTSDTLRGRSSQPNEQNISKKEAECRRCRGEGTTPDGGVCGRCRGTGLSLRSVRHCFGPAPGREWWPMDGFNLELVIPSYEGGQQEFIDLFERPDEPPYYGSNHLLIAHILFPAEFEGCLRDGVKFKEQYRSTLYQRVKNGNFAVQYGAVDRPDGLGTADRTYGLPGAQAIIKQRFGKLEALNQKWIRFANERGYVETIPRKSVDPRRGFPLLCSKNEFGRISPTIPFNYHVQGTACDWKLGALVRCDAALADWRKKNFDGFITLDVHDELVFDLPRKAHPLKDPKRSNLSRTRELARLMRLGGDDIGIPIKVGVDYTDSNWAEGVTIKV